MANAFRLRGAGQATGLGERWVVRTFLLVAEAKMFAEAPIQNLGEIRLCDGGRTLVFRSLTFESVVRKQDPVRFTPGDMKIAVALSDQTGART